MPLPGALGGLVSIHEVETWLEISLVELQELCARGWLDTVTQDGCRRVTEDSLRRLAAWLRG